MKCPACHSLTVNARTGECSTCYGSNGVDLEARRRESQAIRDRLLEGFGEVPRVYSGRVCGACEGRRTVYGERCENCDGTGRHPKEPAAAANEAPKKPGVFAGLELLRSSFEEPTGEELRRLELEAAADELAQLRAEGETILVLVESPFAGKNRDELERNQLYLRAALRDCLERGEAPFASHGLYTLPGVLDDTKPDERRKGIEAGLAWGRRAHLSAVYVDLGISPGMMEGIARAEKEGRPVERRSLLEWARRLA